MFKPSAITLSLLALSAALWTGCTTVAPDHMNESQSDFDARMEWWRDARFGMFIHWGPYAVPAGVYEGEPIRGIGEWIMNTAQIPVAEYEEYAQQFNPVLFDAAEWVRIAKDAGMKYIIITSKHHDGFGLWNSEVSDYDIVDMTPFGRDVLRELADAAAAEGIRLGFYHSIMDWHHPDAQAPHFPTYNTREKSNPNFPAYVEHSTTRPCCGSMESGYPSGRTRWASTCTPWSDP
jgi:alpha-L-fucosidase